MSLIEGPRGVCFVHKDRCCMSIDSRFVQNLLWHGHMFSRDAKRSASGRRRQSNGGRASVAAGRAPLRVAAKRASEALFRSLLPMLATLLLGTIVGAVTSPARAESPTTTPATQPSALSISSDARTLLDAVDAAYGKLTSLELAGTMSQDIRVDRRRARARRHSLPASWLPTFSATR